MHDEQIERFLEYLSHDPVLQRDLARRARTPEQFFANAVRFARLFGYSFSADELRAWAQQANGHDLLKFAGGNANTLPPDQPGRPSSETPPVSDSTHSPCGDNPLRAA